VLNAERATLPDDLGSEIDFIVRRPNAGSELHGHVRRLGAEAFNHLSDRVCDDTELGAFASGMHQAYRRSFRIYNVKRAAVRDVNAERDAAFIGDNAIAAWKFAAINSAADSRRYSGTDKFDFISMNLLRCEQRPVTKAGCVANFPMCGIEAL